MVFTRSFLFFRLFVSAVRVLQWLSWIAVIALAAALPWLVNDWIQKENASPAPVPPADSLSEPASVSAPVPTNELARLIEPVAGPEMSDGPAERSAPEKASDFFRQLWLGLAGSDGDSPAGGARLDSERSREVATRIEPALEAALAGQGLKLGQPVFLRIFKESNELELWMEPSPGAEYRLFKTWPICKWSGDLGPKLKEGDGQSPEGFYFVPARRMNPESQYHLSFDLGFPNDYDRHHLRTGSHLMVHGDCVSIGCYAMTDPAIEEIYTLAAAALREGAPFFRVHVFPYRMTDERMDTLGERAEWFEFWANLKEGYDYFEFVKRPPNVTVADGKYQFE